MILLHGGSAFAKFNDSYGGSNTGKADSVASNTMPTPMYLNESWNATRSYKKNDSGLIWERADKINADPNLRAKLYELLNIDVLKGEGTIEWETLS